MSHIHPVLSAPLTALCLLSSDLSCLPPTNTLPVLPFQPRPPSPSTAACRTNSHPKSHSQTQQQRLHSMLLAQTFPFIVKVVLCPSTSPRLSCLWFVSTLILLHCCCCCCSFRFSFAAPGIHQHHDCDDIERRDGRCRQSHCCLFDLELRVAELHRP